MKKNRFTESQIMSVLKQAEAAIAVSSSRTTRKPERDVSATYRRSFASRLSHAFTGEVIDHRQDAQTPVADHI